MKRRKILVLFPVLGLLLSGCTVQEGFANAKSWISNHIYHPIKDLFTGGGDKKQDSGGDVTPTPTPTPTPGPGEKTVVSIEKVNAPETIVQGKTLAAKDVTLDVKYSDNSTGTVTSTKVELVTEAVGQTSGTAYYNELSKKFSITVIDPPPVQTYTPEDVIAKCDSAGQGNVVDELLRVRGQVALGASKTNNGWSGSFVTSGEKVLKFDSARTDVEIESIEGKVVTIEGYAELYSGTYKVGYLPANVSPTGDKYNPSLISVEDAPQKTIDHVVSVEGPKKVFVGDEFDVEDFVVTVEYTDGEIGQVRPDSILECDTSEPGETTIVLLVGELEATYKVVVQDKPSTIVFDLGEDGEESHADGSSTTTYSETVAGVTLDITDGVRVYKDARDAHGNGCLKLGTSSNKASSFNINLNSVVNMEKIIFNVAQYKSYDDKGTISFDGGEEISITKFSNDGEYDAIEAIIKDEVMEVSLSKRAMINSIEFIPFEGTIVDVESVSIDQEDQTLHLGGTSPLTEVQLSATVLPEDATSKTVTWSSSDTSVATVSSTGLVQAVAAGTTQITAKAGGVTSEAITVTVVQHVESVTIPTSQGVVVGGEAVTLSKTIAPANVDYTSAVWSVEDVSPEGAISIDATTGEISASQVGTAKVYLTVDGVKSNACAVTATATVVHVESVSLDSEELNLEIGQNSSLVATVSPEDATYPEVSWKSSDEEIAKVDDNGVVTGIAVGEATITAEADGKSATCVVTVEEAVVNSVELAYKGAIDGSTDTFTFSGTVVSMSNNSYVLQDGEYAINIYSTPAEGVGLGKLVEIVSTVKLYQGCPQTDSITSVEVKGEGAPQTSAPVTSKEDLDALNHSVLAHVDDAIFVSKNGDWGSNSTKQFVFEIGGDNITVSFDKQGYDADKAAIANAAALGDHFKFTGLVTGAYSGTNQFTFTGTSGIVKTQDAPVPDPTLVTITSGDSLAVGSNMTLTATVGPDGAAQDVEWEIVEGFDYASLSDGVLTGVAEGEVKVKATAVGYENVYAEKTITVSSTGPAVKYATKVTSTSEIVSGAKYYIGYENEGNSFVFSGVDGVSDYESVAVTENGIEQKESLICVEITEIEGGYSLKVVGSTNNGKYMRGTEGKNELKFESTEQLNTISISDGLATIISNTSELVFNSTSGQTRFRYYKPATISGNPTIYLRPCIYMLAE